MKIDFDIFFKFLEPGTIFLLKKHKLKTTEIPHYHIIAGIDHDNETLMLVLTSQENKIIDRFKNLNFPYSTLIPIKPDEYNKLKKVSFADCNLGTFIFTFDELRKLYQDNELIKIGYISEHSFEQIKIGLNNSMLQSEKLLKRFSLKK